MHFESRIKRNFLVNTGLGLVPDILIGVGVAYLTSTGPIGLIGTVVGLQLLYFLIWLKSFLWRLLLLWLTGRKKLASQLFDFLQKSRYPEPDDYIRDVDSYLEGIMNDGRLPCEQRVKAAIEWAGVSYLRQLGFGLYSLQLHLAWEDAIERYKRSFEHARAHNPQSLI